MKELFHKGVRWISSVDGGWKTGGLVPLSAAKDMVRCYKRGIKPKLLKKLLEEYNFKFDGEIIELFALKEKEPPEFATVYLHVNAVSLPR